MPRFARPSRLLSLVTALPSAPQCALVTEGNGREIKKEEFAKPAEDRYCEDIRPGATRDSYLVTCILSLVTRNSPSPAPFSAQIDQINQTDQIHQINKIFKQESNVQIHQINKIFKQESNVDLTPSWTKMGFKRC